METTGSALFGVVQSFNQVAGATASYIDEARRLEGQTIFDEARLTITQRQNEAIQRIKSDPTISVDKWGEEYDKIKDSIGEGYQVMDNKYAGPEVKNLLADLKENARASFAVDEGNYRKAAALTNASTTLERALEARDQIATTAALETMRPLLSPQDHANAMQSSANSFLYNQAMTDADAFITAGDIAGARKAVSETDYAVTLGTRQTMNGGIREKARAAVEQKWKDHTTQSDEANALKAQDLLNLAWRNGQADVGKLTEYMGMIGGMGFYDANTEHFWWAQGKMLLDNASSGEDKKKNELWDLNAFKLAARCASGEFLDKKTYNELVYTMTLSGGLDPAKGQTYFNYFDTPDYKLTDGLQAFIDRTSEKDKKGVPILSKQQQNTIVAAVTQIRKENPDKTTDELNKIADDLGNEAIKKNFGNKAAGKLPQEKDPNNSGASESLLSLLNQGVLQGMDEKGSFDIWKESMGLNAEITVQNLKDSVGNSAIKTVQQDMDRYAKITGGNKPLGTTFQWDDALNAPVFTVKRTGTDGKPYSENYSMRIMTQDYLDDHRDIINARTKANRQKIPRVGEEYLSLITNTNPSTYMEINGVMREMKKPPRWEETYFSLLGDTGRD